MPKKISYSYTKNKALEAFNYIIKISHSIFFNIHQECLKYSIIGIIINSVKNVFFGKKIR